MAVPSLKLNSGHDMPMFGLGTWKSPAGKVEEAVKCCLDLGYTHVDCARAYGNEHEVGNALTEKFKDGTVKRENVFVTSKLWNVHHDPKDVKPALQKTLKDLQLDYLDLYLIHWPQAYPNRGDGNLFPKDENGKFYYSDTDYVDTWKAMMQLVDEGLVKSIGVSNFNEYQINRVIDETKCTPAVSQVEIHPYLVNEGHVQYCKSKGIAVTAYSPLGSGDRPWAKAGEPVLLEDPALKKIADRLGKTVAQVVLRYQIQRGIIVIPKSVTPSRIESNFKLFDFELTDDDMKTVSGFNRNFRGCLLEWVSDHKYYPFKENYSEEKAAPKI